MNWYKIAKEKAVKKPYKVVLVKQDIEQTPKQLEGVRKDAYSSEQARMLFLKDYPFLRDYYQMNYEVEVRPDVEEIQRRKEQEEQQIQNSWWNQ